MIDFVLVLVIFGLCGLIGFLEYENRKERAKLVNAIMAKNNQEMVNLTLADHTKVEPVRSSTPPDDLIPTDELSDEMFEKMIAEQNRVVDIAEGV